MVALPPDRRTAAPSPPALSPARRSHAAGAVLRAILDHGPVARSTVARLTGLSPAAVSGHCTQFVARGLVAERPQATGPRGLGRPHIPLEIDTDRYLVAGAHIAVAHTTLALADLRGRIVATERRTHGGAGSDPRRVLGDLAERLPHLAEAHAGGRTVLALGVATGQRVDPGAGVIVHHPGLGWRDVAVRDALAGATGLPVHLDSHSRALAAAEQLFGAVATRGSAVLLFVGAVVDAAFATAGGVHRGPRSAAGSVAHLPVAAPRTASDAGSAAPPEPCTCGTPGCLQSEASEPALVRQAAALGLGVPDGRALLDLALAAEPRAVALFRRRARLVGRAAALLLDAFDPDVVVVVEQGTGRLPECLDVMRAEVAARSSVCDDPVRLVVPSSFTGSVLPVAGAAVALGALYADPQPAWPALPAVC